ncbi:MAG: transposase [Holophaga sp.]|nr:transposase [Holophaga sp.]
MTVREIQAFLEEQYGAKVSPDLISDVTDAVMEEVRSWQVRPLEKMYPIVFLDALRVKIRDEGHGDEQGCLHGLGRSSDGTGMCWASGLNRPRRQILARRGDRASESRCGSNPVGSGGWVKGLSRGD